MEVFLLVTQVVLFSIIFLYSNLFDLFTSFYLILILFLGIIVGLWGLLSLGKASYSPFPKPKKGNKFSRQGAYKFMRHPIYTGLMLIALVLHISKFIFPGTIVFVLFVLITNYKANIEEKLMEEKHTRYKKYKQKTWKYIPFLF